MMKERCPLCGLPVYLQDSEGALYEELLCNGCHEDEEDARPGTVEQQWDADDGGPGQDYNSAYQDLLDPF